MRLRLPSRWAAWAAIAVCALVACGHPPAQVHYFPRGKPPKLSDWRVLEVSGGELKLNTGVVPYDLNTPLFSDYAHKLRTVWMPPGTSATYASDASFDFPVGTIVSKTFYYPLPAVKHDGKSVSAPNMRVRSRIRSSRRVYRFGLWPSGSLRACKRPRSNARQG